MRIPALATLALLAILGAAAAGEEGWSLQGGPSYEAGVGAVAGMTAKQAVYLKGSTPSRRLRLTLRLKNEGKVSTNVSLGIRDADGSGFVAGARNANLNWTSDDSGDWRQQQFVVDVPDTASELILDVRMRDAGVVWLDELKLEAMGPDVPLSRTSRTSFGYSGQGGIDYGGGAQPNTLAPDPQASAPLINGSFVQGGTPITQPGSSPRP
jgi:hypothetical protein